MSTMSGVPSLQTVEKSLPPDLPVGDYLLVTWDCLFHKGHLLQLGAYMTHSGKSMVQNIKPEVFEEVLNEQLSKRITYTKSSTNVSF